MTALQHHTTPPDRTVRASDGPACVAPRVVVGSDAAVIARSSAGVTP